MPLFTNHDRKQYGRDSCLDLLQFVTDLGGAKSHKHDTFICAEFHAGHFTLDIAKLPHACLSVLSDHQRFFAFCSPERACAHVCQVGKIVEPRSFPMQDNGNVKTFSGQNQQANIATF